MARDYGRIRAQFWNDEKVKAWPLDLKAVAAYLLTCEHSTALGAFRLPAAYMSDDLDLVPSEARDLLGRLERTGWLKVCAATGWVWIVNYLKHNRPENVNVWKHIRGLANAMPSNVSFRADVLASIERRTDDAKETVSEGGKGDAIQSANGSETVSNNNTDPILTEPIQSVPSQEDARSAPTAPPIADQIWQAGVPYLENHGLTSKAARSLLGKWRKEHGDAHTLTTLIAAQTQGVSEPVAWMERALKNGGKQGQSGRGRAAEQWDARRRGAALSAGYRCGPDGVWYAPDGSIVGDPAGEGAPPGH